MRKVELAGRKIGRLLVIKALPSKRGKRWWLCQCECGNETQAITDHLHRALIRSCGCLARELASGRMKTHGQATHGRVTREYVAWSKAKSRCYNANDDHYPYYGARGIKMAAEWINDFPAFLAHIGPKPDPSLTLDRIEVDGDYAPGNVRWASRKEQRLNQRRMK